MPDTIISCLSEPMKLLMRLKMSLLTQLYIYNMYLVINVTFDIYHLDLEKS